MSSFDVAQDDSWAQDDMMVTDAGTNNSVIVSTVELLRGNETVSGRPNVILRRGSG